MADNRNIKLAIKAVMEARSRGIVWKLILQIVLDRPSAIINAWAAIDKSPEQCPEKVLICGSCGSSVRVVGSDGRCGRCVPLSNF